MADVAFLVISAFMWGLWLLGLRTIYDYPPKNTIDKMVIYGLTVFAFIMACGTLLAGIFTNGS